MRLALASMMTLLAAFHQASAQSTCRIQLVGSGNGPLGAALEKSAIKSAIVSCRGEPVLFTGVPAMSSFGAEFAGTATFKSNVSATSLLSVSGVEITVEGSYFTNLAVGSNSILTLVGGSLTMTGATFRGNDVTGAASPLSLSGVKAVVSDSVFIGNSAEARGGALMATGGSMQLMDTSFVGNSAGVAGGGMHFTANKAAIVSLVNVTMRDNYAVCRGGALDLISVGDFEMAGGLFTNNSVLEYAGSATGGGDCINKLQLAYTSGNALHAEDFQTAVINATEFVGNGGNGDGGAIFLRGGNLARLLSVNFTGNSQMEGSVGAGIVVRVPTTVLTSCTFDSNTGPTAGGIQFVQATRLNITDSLFINNRGLRTSESDGAGGGLAMIISCVELCWVADNRFLGNSLDSGDGGALYASNPGNLTATNNIFDSNSATNTGGAFAVVGSGEAINNNDFTLNNNIFTNNTASGKAGSGGAIALNNLLNIRVINCVISNNTALVAGGGLWVTGLSNSRAVIQNCTFTGNLQMGRNGGGMFLASMQSAVISDSNFTANSASVGSGMFAAEVSGVTMLRCKHDVNVATEEGGAAFVESADSLSVTDCTYLKNSARGGQGGGWSLNAVGEANFTRCTFSGNSALTLSNTGGFGGACNLESSRLVRITNSTFDRNEADDRGGAVYANKMMTMVYSGNSFKSNSATNAGGAVIMESSANCVFSDDTWESNKARTGGGVAVSNVTTSAMFSNETFSGNTAGANGGGIAIVNTRNAARLNIMDSTITGNSAEVAGGGVALLGSTGVTLNISSSMLSDNKAGCGGAIFADSNALLAQRNVVFSENTATNSKTASVGCSGCRTSTNGGPISSIDNAASLDPGGNGATTGDAGGGSSSASTGLIVGVVVGAVAASLAVTTALVLLLYRRHRRRDTNEKRSERSNNTKNGGGSSVSAINQRNTVPSAFSSEGHGSFWSAKKPATEVEGTDAGLDSHRLGELGFRGIDTDKSSTLARSNTPLINMTFSGASASTARTNTPDMTTMSDWQIDARDIEVARRDDGREWKLGGGAFGEVYKALLKGVNPVAVKVLRDQSYTSREDFSREVALLKSLYNSHIVQFQGACVDDDKMLLITEFMDGGDLFKAIARKQVNWSLRGKSIAMDVLRGLHFLHSKRIVHMDLKSPNILLTRHGVAKLADVGLARVIRDRNYITQVSVIGTFAWAAPEVLTNERCTEKADMYSFGIVLWELVTGEQPIRGGRRELRVPEECSQDLSELVDQCLATDPAKRPSALEALNTLQRIDRDKDIDVQHP